MADLTLVEAVNDCLHVELERDSSVMVLGEDVGRSGGVFRATAGLRDRFGPDRCFDTPLAEAGILGTAVGLCMAGWRPVCEAAADALDDVSVEVLDIRSLKPLDEDALLASAAKTGRVVIVQEAPRTLGFAAELAAVLAEKAILDLRGPVLRVTGFDVPYPYWQLEDAYVPSVERVAAAASRLLEFS